MCPVPDSRKLSRKNAHFVSPSELWLRGTLGSLGGNIFSHFSSGWLWRRETKLGKMFTCQQVAVVVLGQKVYEVVNILSSLKEL